MLSFDRTDHDALYEVLLEEGAQAYDRQDRNDDHNVNDLLANVSRVLLRKKPVAETIEGVIESK